MEGRVINYGFCLRMARRVTSLVRVIVFDFNAVVITDLRLFRVGLIDN